MFQAQRCQSVLDKLTDNNIQVVFVPACCTDKLQPLDLTVNKDLKNSLNHQFHQWYAAEVAEHGRWGVTIPRKRPKKTRNPEKDLKKTEKDFIFNRTLFIYYYNLILYISMCSKHVFASLFYVNDRNTAYSRPSLVCSVPVLLSFGTNAPPGELYISTRPLSKHDT